MATEMTLGAAPYEFWRRDHLPVMKKTGFRCGECNTPFQAELPYECEIDVWSKAIKKLRCPHCDSKKLFMGENRTLTEDRSMRRGKTFAERVDDWKANGEHGLSSDAMFAHFTGEMQAVYPCPRDLADLRRCIVMLDRFPEWKGRGASMGRYPGWEKLAAQWDQITAEFEAGDDCTSETALQIFLQG